MIHEDQGKEGHPNVPGSFFVVEIQFQSIAIVFITWG